MDMTVCPRCKMRVFPKADGACPSCGARLKSAAKTHSAGRTMSAPSPKEQVRLSKRRSQIASSSMNTRPLKRIGKFNYGEVLLKPVKIIWKHKRLSVPAILMNAISWLYSIMILSITSSIQAQTKDSSSTGLIFLIPLAAIVLVVPEIYLGCASFFIPSVGTFQADNGKLPGSLRDSFKKLSAFFWRIIGVNILLGIIILAVMLPIFCIVVLSSTSWLSNPQAFYSHTWVIYILGFVISPVVSGFEQQSLLAIIIENRGISEALSRGWKIFTHFVGVNLLMGLILFTINFGIVYLCTIPQNLFINQIQSILTGGKLDLTTILTYSGVGILYWVLFSVLIGTLGTYVQSVWTLTFLRLTRPASAKVANA
jgi:uncharacterized Zn finger protein (UPF0148 family)